MSDKQEDPTQSQLIIQERFSEALLERNRPALWQMLEELSTTYTPIAILDQVVTPSLEYIGDEWKRGNVALSQVYMSGRMCEEVIESYFPRSNITRADSPTIAIAVLQDHHVLGKRIIEGILRMMGHQLVDYGHGVEVDFLVQQVQNDHVQILFISALMLPSALLVREVCQQLKAINPNIKIIVGGAPFRFDDQLWQFVGADAMGYSASDTIQIMKDLFPTA